MIISTVSPCNTSSGDGAKGKSCVIGLRVASLIPAEQLPIFSHNVSYKTSKFSCADRIVASPDFVFLVFAILVMGSYEKQMLQNQASMA